jgi:hypothetical protein
LAQDLLTYALDSYGARMASEGGACIVDERMRSFNERT